MESIIAEFNGYATEDYNESQGSKVESYIVNGKRVLFATIGAGSYGACEDFISSEFAGHTLSIVSIERIHKQTGKTVTGHAVTE